MILRLAKNGFIMWMLLLSSICVKAQLRFHTDQLEQMATALKINGGLNTLADGEYYGYTNYNGKPITVIIAKGEVMHIGYTYFTHPMRQAFHPAICNFLERYPLYLTLPIQHERSVMRHLDEDGVFFRNGTFNTLCQLAGDTTLGVVVDNLAGKRYAVSFKRKDKDVLTVNFPIEHELLLGTDILENERRLAKAIQYSPSEPREIPPPDPSELRLTWQKQCFVQQRDSFYTQRLNSNRYYEKKKTGIYVPFYRPTHIAESLSSLLTTGGVENDYNLQIRMVKYGFVQDTLTVRLNQWVNFCLNEGCEGFFGIISTEGDMADCELIMLNRDMGYIHLMRLSVDLSTLADRRGTIKARLNSYINTTRVKYLFDELKK